MRVKVKYMVIYRHKERYPISVMCQFFGVSRSGYYGFCKRIGDPEPDAELAELLQSQQERCRQTYGYRRMWLWLEKQGIHRNPKITPSMSRRGNCYDNAMAENFFSILKTECIYRQKIRTFQQAKELIDDFIYFYNHERILLKTGETPLAQRLSA